MQQNKILPDTFIGSPKRTFFSTSRHQSKMNLIRALNKLKRNFKFFNAQSVMNKLAELHYLLRGESNQYDIICVTESWLSDNVSVCLFVADTSYSIFVVIKMVEREEVQPSLFMLL